jgi:hypothetical protein
VALILLASGIFFAALLLLNNLLKTLFRREKVGFVDLLLVFLVTFVTLTGLIANNTVDIPDPLVERTALWLSLGLVGASLFVVILEIFRPQRLRGSRGILGVFGGVLLAVSTFTVPFAAVYFTITPNVTATTAGDDATAEADATDALVERTERFDTLFRAVRQVIAEEIEVDEVLVFTQLDAGKPLAEIVAENGGNVERVIERLSEIMKAGIREAASRGEMNALQAALLVSQMDNLVLLAVNANLTDFGSRFGGPTPTGTRPSLLTLLTETPRVTEETAPTATATLQPTVTSTPLPTDTHTPRPTPTPSATRFRFSTRTPTPTPTPVTPCLASVEYNLRLRAQPSQDAETLLVIPYTTTLELYGHSADSTWWLTTYGGEHGWVDGTYMMLSAACSTLPTLDNDSVRTYAVEDIR